MEGAFYVFVAQGQGIGSILSGARGGIMVGGVKNADAWKEQLLSAYPNSRQMEFVMIASSEWEHPEVGFLNKDTKINFNPYLKAIKKHLQEKIGLSSKRSDEIVSIIESKNLCVADFWDGALRFGVPMAASTKTDQKHDQEEKQKRDDEQYKTGQSEQWRKQGLCRYCGGEISGLFAKKCKSCGKLK